MPKPRKTLISLDATPYYHCVSRCVRRAFLCGSDGVSGRSFEHRRGWIRERLIALTDIFAIDVCAYAVMANHTHLVLHVDHAAAQQWSATEICQRWLRLFSGNPLARRYLDGDPLAAAEQARLDRYLDQWRSRLMDVSWFMRCLNEDIARRANREDDCTGRFWEGRFKSQALLDEKALTACMAYVDLNPLRAGLADRPEACEFTSVQDRAAVARQTAPEDPEDPARQPAHLMPFAGNPHEPMPRGLPFRLTDYLDLVDWTGRAIIEGKRVLVDGALPPIIERLRIDPTHWLFMAQRFESQFKGLVGAAQKLRETCRALGYRRTPNFQACRALLN